MIGNRADSICLVALSPLGSLFRSMGDAAHIDNRSSGAFGRSRVACVEVAESDYQGGAMIPEHYARDIVERCDRLIESLLPVVMDDSDGGGVPSAGSGRATNTRRQGLPSGAPTGSRDSPARCPSVRRCRYASRARLRQTAAAAPPSIRGIAPSTLRSEASRTRS